MQYLEKGHNTFLFNKEWKECEGLKEYADLNQNNAHKVFVACVSSCERMLHDSEVSTRGIHVFIHGCMSAALFALFLPEYFLAPSIWFILNYAFSAVTLY